MSLDTDTTQPSELDDCTVWILQHNETFYNTGIPDHRQIEWLENCIGQQRYVKKENHRKKWNILFIYPSSTIPDPEGQSHLSAGLNTSGANRLR